MFIIVILNWYFKAPNYAEPFQALSMFYEDLGEFEKSYQLSLIAAYLSPQDADEWLRLAEVGFTKDFQIFDRTNFSS